MAAFAKRLSHRFYATLAAALIAVSLLFLLLFVGYYRTRIVAERSQTSAEINGVLQIALENAMLKRDIAGLQAMVERLGSTANVRRLMILNAAGEVRFASRGRDIGRKLPPDTAAICQGCAATATGAAAGFVMDREAGDVLRSVNPIANRAACRECHGDAAAHPVNGILVVDYDGGEIRSEARTMALALAGSGVLVLLAGAAAIGWVTRRTVLRPVQALQSASAALARGEPLAAEALAAAGSDEISELTRSFRQMSERIAEQRNELRARERFLQDLIDAAPDGMRVIADDYSVVMVNQAFCRLHERTRQEVLASPCYASSHGRDEPCAPTMVTCPLHEFRSSDEPLICRHVHQHRSGAQLPVEVSAAVLQVGATQGQSQRRLVVESIRDLSRDITHSHEQRLSELGQLAAGVAHEIRNPLSSIRLTLLQLQKAAANGAGAAAIRELEHLELMDEEIDRCIQITDRLLKLSSPPLGHPELVELGVVVPEVASLLASEAEQRGLELDLRLDGPLRVIASDSDMRMLTLNLMQNAFHAMPEGGRLRIEARTEDAEVRLTFHDTGVGIAEQDLSRIFQPFWSRRADGSHGTGLGLPICREILRRHAGRITVASIPGKGTSVSIWLPWAEVPRKPDEQSQQTHFIDRG